MTFLYNDNIVDTSTLNLKLLKSGKHCHIKIIDDNKCVVHIDVKVHGYVFQYDYDIIRHEDVKRDYLEDKCGRVLFKTDIKK